jgi:hypothetical protein
MHGPRGIQVLTLALALGCGEAVSRDPSRDEAPGVGAGAGFVPGPVPEARELCDGSEEVRFIYSAGGGINSFDRGPYSRSFTAFYVIDGHCNYWLGGSGNIQGAVGGTIEAERARQLSTELHFGQYSSVAAYRERATCVDGGYQLLSDGTGVLEYTCFDDRGAPRIWVDAMRASFALYEELQREGTPRWRPTRVLVRQTLPDPWRTAADWTSVLDLAPHAVDFNYTNGKIDGDPFSLLIEDEPTLDLLDRLRSAELAVTEVAADLYVKDARGDYYIIAVTDVLPEFVESAVLGLMVE